MLRTFFLQCIAEISHIPVVSHVLTRTNPRIWYQYHCKIIWIISSIRFICHICSCILNTSLCVYLPFKIMATTLLDNVKGIGLRLIFYFRQYTLEGQSASRKLKGMSREIISRFFILKLNQCTRINPVFKTFLVAQFISHFIIKFYLYPFVKCFIVFTDFPKPSCCRVQQLF